MGQLYYKMRQLLQNAAILSENATFSRSRTELKILSFHKKMQVKENPCPGIFYAVESESWTKIWLVQINIYNLLKVIWPDFNLSAGKKSFRLKKFGDMKKNTIFAC